MRRLLGTGLIKLGYRTNGMETGEFYGIFACFFFRDGNGLATIPLMEGNIYDCSTCLLRDGRAATTITTVITVTIAGR